MKRFLFLILFLSFFTAFLFPIDTKFIENRGQYPEEIKFYTSTTDGIMFAGDNFFGFSTKKNGTSFTYKIFVKGKLKAGEKNITKVSIYKGKKYFKDLSTYKTLFFISKDYKIKLYKKNKRVEWDIITENLDGVKLKYEIGSGKLKAKGNRLYLLWNKGKIVETIPKSFTYEKTVDVIYKVTKRNVVKFSVKSNENIKKPLKITVDPSTFLGGSGDDICKTIKIVDPGRVIIGGTCTSLDGFPTSSNGTVNYTNTNGSDKDIDIFIAKTSLNLKVLYKIVFLGSDEDDEINSMKISEKEIFICGYTKNPDGFLSGNISNVYESNHGFGSQAGFLVTLDLSSFQIEKNKSLLIGDLNPNECYDIAVASPNSVYICGLTGANTDFSRIFTDNTTGKFLSPKNFKGDTGFVMMVEFDNIKPEIKYGTYVGGVGGTQRDTEEACYGICLGEDSSGVKYVYVCGYTKNKNLPASDNISSISNEAAFLSKIKLDLSEFSKTIYIDGHRNDEAKKITVDPSKKMLFIGGDTDSNDLHISNGSNLPSWHNLNGGQDCFILCTDTDLTFDSLNGIPVGTSSNDEFGDFSFQDEGNGNLSFFLTGNFNYGKIGIAKITGTYDQSNQVYLFNFNEPEVSTSLGNGAGYGVYPLDNCLFLCGTTDSTFSVPQDALDHSCVNREGFITSLKTSDLSVVENYPINITVTHVQPQITQPVNKNTDDILLNTGVLSFSLDMNSITNGILSGCISDGVTFYVRLSYKPDTTSNTYYPLKFTTTQSDILFNNLTNLALISSNNEVQQFPLNSVQIVKWLKGDNEIKIKINPPPQTNTISNLNGFFSIFINDDEWPFNSYLCNNNLYTNFGDSDVGCSGGDDITYQETTMCIVKNFFNQLQANGLPLSGSIYATIGTDDNSVIFTGPVQTGTEIHLKLSDYNFNTDLNLPIGKIKKIASSIRKFVISDVGSFPVIDENTGQLRIRKGRKKDFVSINSKYKSIFIFFREGDGKYFTYKFSKTPISLTSADLDGDGVNEIIVGFLNGNIGIYSIHNILNAKMDSGFLTKIFEIKTSSEPVDLKSVDINKDGKYDLLYLDTSNDNFVILYGDDYTEKREFPLDGVPSKMTIADVNGDGNEDICIAKLSGSSLSILYNNGNGDYNPEEISPGNYNFSYNNIDSGDFNRDGISDLALSSENSKTIVITFGTAGGVIYNNDVGFSVSPSAISVSNFDALNGDDVLVGFSDYWELALCTSDENGNVTAKYSLNTLDDVVVDPDSGVILPENDIVNINDGLTYGGMNDRTGVVGITQQKFNLFYFPKSKDISFSLVNINSENNLLMNFELYDDSGNLDNYTSSSIQPNSQFAGYFSSDEIFGDSVSDDKFVRLFITKPYDFGIYLFNSPTNLNALDGGKLISAGDTKTNGIFPTLKLEGDGFTNIYLINPFKTENNLKLSLISKSGEVKETKSFLFNPREEKIFNVKELFDSAEENDYISITSDDGFLGVESFGTSETLAVLPSIYPKENENIIYSPHVVSGTFGDVVYNTKINLINTSNEEVTLNIYLLSDNGEEIASINEYTIGPKNKLESTLKDLFNLSDNSGISGYLKVESSDSSSIVGSFTFENSNETVLSSIPFTSEKGSFILGHIANGENGGINYWTGIAILSPDSDENVSIKVYDKNGTLLGEKEIQLQAGQRFVSTLDGDSLFPGMGTVMGGWITVESDDNNLIAVELFGDSNLSIMSVVPAIKIEDTESE